MINKQLFPIFLLHFALGLGGFLALSAWSLGSADAAIATDATTETAAESVAESAATGWVEGIVHYGLLQPVAHWVLSAGLIAWWTWPGLLALIVLIAANSAVVAALYGLARHRFR